MAKYRWYMAACMYKLYIQGQMGRSPSRAAEAMMSRVHEMMQNIYAAKKTGL